MKDLAVVIVSYNVSAFLEQTIYAAQKALQGLNGEIWVVDNHSSDGSAQMVEKFFPEVRLLALQENLGFAKANNKALREIDAEFVLLLNPDTLVAEDTFNKCIAYCRANQSVGALGVRMINGRGEFLRESKRGLPTPMVAFWKMIGFSKLFPTSPYFSGYYEGDKNEFDTNEVDVLSGAFMFMRSSALHTTGFLDENYFMYGEDIDLSYRIGLAGYKVVYFPETTIIHYKGESTSRASFKYVKHFYEAMLIFSKRHFAKNQFRIISPLVHFAIYVRAILALFARLYESNWLKLADAGLVYLGMIFLKTYWELNHKHVPNYYPSDFVFGILPAYVITWLVFVFLSGGYERPFRPLSVMRGVIFGTLFISGFTNFFDDYRFSKALILLGGTWTSFVLLGTRFVFHLVKYGSLSFGDDGSKKIIVAASNLELDRVQKILIESRPKFKIAEVALPAQSHKIENLQQIHLADEWIFSLRDYSAKQIINVLDSGFIPSLRILSPNSETIIGSNSSTGNGEIYSIHAKLYYYSEVAKRNRRMNEILVSLSLLFFPPIWLLFNRPQKLLRNLFLVLIGKKELVGIGENNRVQSLITPSAHLNNPERVIIEKLNFWYIKHYQVADYWNLLKRNFRRLAQ